MNLDAIPAGLGSAADIYERGHRVWERHTSHWRSHLQDAYDYVAPNRSSFYDDTEGEKKNLTLYDDTAVIEARTYRSKLKSLVAPAGREWTQMRPGSDHKDVEDDSETLADLQDANDILYSYINGSNADLALDEALVDYTISTGAFTINEGPDNDSPLIFQAHFAPTVAIEEGPNGEPENHWRKCQPYLHMIERTWLGSKLTPDMRKQLHDAKGKPEKYDVLEGTIYNTKNKRFYGVLIDPKSKTAIWVYDYEESSPWVSFRAPKAPGETMGRGVGLDILPTVKMLNKVKEMSLRNAAIELAGIYTHSDSSAINPYTAKIVPGGMIPVKSNNSRNPTLARLPRGENFDLSMFAMAEMKDDIKRTFLASLRDPDGPVRSATEIAIDDRDLARQEASAFGRLTRELIEATVRRCAFILTKRGLLPEMKLDGQDVRVKHVTPLARAQDNEELLALTGALERSNQLLGPEVTFGGIKVEEVPQYIFEKVGAEMSLVRSKDDREELQQLVAQLIASQQQGATDAA